MRGYAVYCLSPLNTKRTTAIFANKNDAEEYAKERNEYEDCNYFGPDAFIVKLIELDLKYNKELQDIKVDGMESWFECDKNK